MSANGSSDGFLALVSGKIGHLEHLWDTYTPTGELEVALVELSAVAEVPESMLDAAAAVAFLWI